MDKKKILLLMAAGFVVLIAGASVLYGRLSAEMKVDQLAVKETQPAAEEVQPTAEETQPETEAEEMEPETAAETEAEVPEQIMAPDFTAYDVDGNPMKLSDYIGKPVVLNFWASWCGPCRSEMADFNEKYLELGEDVQFLMVNMTDGSGETVEAASEFVAEEGYEFPVFYDTGSEAAIAYTVMSLPTTFFISADGEVIAHAMGAIDGETLQRGIDMIVTEE